MSVGLAGEGARAGLRPQWLPAGLPATAATVTMRFLLIMSVTAWITRQTTDVGFNPFINQSGPLTARLEARGPRPQLPPDFLLILHYASVISVHRIGLLRAPHRPTAQHASITRSHSSRMKSRYCHGVTSDKRHI